MFKVIDRHWKLYLLLKRSYHIARIRDEQILESCDAYPVDIALHLILCVDTMKVYYIFSNMCFTSSGKEKTITFEWVINRNFTDFCDD